MSRAGGSLTGYQYERYMRSDHWKARKAAYYAVHQKKCAACSTGRNIHLHHVRYDNLWAELDDDLVPLCERCHSEVHHRHDEVERGMPLDLITARFIVLSQKMIARQREIERERGKRRKPAERGLAPIDDSDDNTTTSGFVPLRQRMTYEQRRNEAHSGKVGRLSGLPIRRI